MANMIPISTVTVGNGGVATISFTGIPQIYTDLLLKLSGRGTVSQPNGGQLVWVYPNGDTSNRSGRRFQGDGSSTSSSSTFYGINIGTSDATANTFGNGEIYITNYSDNTKNKSLSIDSVYENNGTTAVAGFSAQLYSQNNPITSITLTPYDGSFVQYSTATLYGIRKY